MQNSFRIQPMGMKTKIAVGVAVFIVVGAGIGTWKRQAILARYADIVRPAAPVITEVPLPQNNKPVSTKPSNTPKPTVAPQPLPKEFNLGVPFVKQAPLGVWDATHEETCEEASVLTVHAYYDKLTLSDDEQERELLKLVAVQEKLFGYFEDTTVAETIQFAKSAYGFKTARVIEKPSLDDIKREIFAGRPVLVPANGKKLLNPNFKNGGPKYHLIVARGWNEKGIFTNDPGTRKGENYFYTNSVLMDAIADWNPEEQLATGSKRVFVLIP